MVPKLTGERIVLCPLCETDLRDIHRLNSSPKVAQFNTLGIPQALADTRRVMSQVLDEKTDGIISKYGWTVRLGGSLEFMGEVGMSLAPARFKKAEIFYNLLPQFWAFGYGTEAVKLMLKFGFETLKLHRMEAGVAVANTPSIHLLEKIGMKREGRAIKILPIDGAWQDNYSYAILEEDYFAEKL